MLGIVPKLPLGVIQEILFVIELMTLTVKVPSNIYPLPLIARTMNVYGINSRLLDEYNSGGVPVMTPLLLNETPAGNAPLITEKLTGAPLLALSYANNSYDTGVFPAKLAMVPCGVIQLNFDML